MIHDGAPGTAFVYQMLASNLAAQSEEYREARLELLSLTCQVAKVHHPEVSNVVGLAVDMYPNETRSLDVSYLDTSNWNGRDQKRALRIGRELGLTKQVQRTTGISREYESPLAPLPSSLTCPHSVVQEL